MLTPAHLCDPVWARSQHRGRNLTQRHLWHQSDTDPPSLSASQGLHSEEELILLINKTELEAKIRREGKRTGGIIVFSALRTPSLPSEGGGGGIISFIHYNCCSVLLPGSTPSMHLLHTWIILSPLAPLQRSFTKNTSSCMRQK